MKTAVSSYGQIVAASEAAPAEATCPKCGGIVILRVRRLMANSGHSYYWQHLDENHPCYRQKPFMRLRLGA